MARVVGRQPVGEGEADNLVARLFIGGKFESPFADKSGNRRTPLAYALFRWDSSA